MPIFQADLCNDRRTSFDAESDHEQPTEPIVVDPPEARLRRLSEESLRTELCEGPVPDSPTHLTTPERNNDASITSSRVELIERLKRGESPTWIPHHNVRDYSHDLLTAVPSARADGRAHIESMLQHSNSVQVSKTSRKSPESSSLLPPAQITPEKNDKVQYSGDQRVQDGLNIQRPRSALHSGDFTQEEQSPAKKRRSPTDLDTRRRDDSIPTHAPWIATSPPRHFTPFQFEKRSLRGQESSSVRSEVSSLSSCLASSFAYQPPTSPLVQSESNDESDFSEHLNDRNYNNSSRFEPSRYMFDTFHLSPFASPSSRVSISHRMSLGGRREASLPYQAHQPRRSLTSTPSFLPLGASPQSPALLRSRRPSFGSDSSPIQHASMVGSYEESILRGRMSTTPSKPFDFLAQIGVLGKGECKSSLRCPPHVTLPFPAVYYSYNSASQGRSQQSEDGPSPYVGQVDLENGLPNLEEESRLRRKAHSRYSEKIVSGDDGDILMPGVKHDAGPRRATRPKRRSGSPKAPPGGSYRIPEKGQIQIIVKNQNKTAVKLFLVPYDLTGMEPGTKTFIRQRIYSAGPIIDDAPGLTQADSMSRPILRYLVHLHICSPAKGRFYLYKSIRMVFANRVPDGKEKLRNETTWPEPRYTPYKPIRVMHPSNSTGPGATLAADTAFRRRSLGIPIGSSYRTFDHVDEVHSPGRLVAEQMSSFGNGNTLPLEPIPFRLPSRDRGDSDGVSDSTSITGTGLRSPGSSQASRPSTKDSAALGHWGATQYEKLSKGDQGYGGNVFSLSGVGSVLGGTEGLLSQRLRSLGVKQKTPDGRDDLN